MDKSRLILVDVKEEKAAMKKYYLRILFKSSKRKKEANSLKRKKEGQEGRE